MSSSIKDWWNANSRKYQEDSKIPTDSAHYGPYAPFENSLNLLGDVRGKRILEIGCGGGQCSIAFSKQGAHCIGFDVSEDQLSFATALAKKEQADVEFILGSFEKLNMLNSGSQDIVFSAFALQYAPDLGRVFSEVRRVLSNEGRFIFSVDHPFYVIFDALAPRLKSRYFRIERSYFDTGKSVKKWPDNSKRSFWFYKRKISDIYNSLTSSGFFVQQIIEPFDSTQDLWKEIFPQDLCELIGPTLIFVSKRI